MNIIVFDFLFSSTLRVTAHNMLRLDAKLEIWGFRPSFLLGALLGNRHSSASFSSKATSCGKVSKLSVCRRRKKWVGKKKKETCAKYKIDRSQNARSNKNLRLWDGWRSTRHTNNSSHVTTWPFNFTQRVTSWLLVWGLYERETGSMRRKADWIGNSGKRYKNMKPHSFY